MQSQGEEIRQDPYTTDKMGLEEGSTEDTVQAHGSVPLKSPGENEHSKQVEGDTNVLIYGINDNPAWYLCVLFALQQVSLAVSSCITLPLVISELICAGHLETVRAQLVSTYLVMCGVCTLLQCILGVRLPIIQGGANTFILPIMAMVTTEKFRCPEILNIPSDNVGNTTGNLTPSINNSLDETEVWQVRMREVQGAIILASLTEVICGCTGIVGLFLNYIGPIPIMVTLSLVGLSLVSLTKGFCQVHWGMSLLTLGILIIFSIYINKIQPPCPAYNPQQRRKCSIVRYPFFELFPVLLAVAISWILCWILTLCDVFPNDPNSKGYYARTDARMKSLDTAPWIYFPYPFQWGWPTVSLHGYLGFLTATIASIVESIGDYYAAARVCGMPALPPHAVNRGIALEGLGGMISGMVGSGGASVSYSQNIGAIAVTRVGSRRAFIWAGCIFVVAGLFGKLGALLSMIPDPVLGGIYVMGLGMVISVGLSNLAFIDIESTRNQVIIGVSLMVGLMIPSWLQENPNAINTGSVQIDQIFQVLLGQAVFVGGFISLLLDDTVPGTDEERGILKWRQTRDLKGTGDVGLKEEDPNSVDKVYGIPLFQGCLEKQRWTRYVPICPTFKSFKCSCSNSLCCKSCRKVNTDL